MGAAFHAMGKLQRLELANAGCAKVLALKRGHALHSAAKDAAGLIYFEDNALSVHKKLERIFFLDPEALTDLCGKHNSSQFVNFANNTGRFHDVLLSGRNSLTPLFYSFRTFLSRDKSIFCCLMSEEL